MNTNIVEQLSVNRTFFMRRNICITLLFASLVAALYTCAAVVKISYNVSDFITHARVAERMLVGGPMPPHFLYQYLLIGLHKISGLSFFQSTYVVVFLMVFFTFLVAYRGLRGTKHEVIYLVLATTFLLVSHPIPIVFPYDRHLLYGYIASNVYHNPSILLLKLIAITHFLLLCRLLKEERWSSRSWLDIALIAVLTAVSTIAKPNYVIVLLPGLCILLYLNRKNHCFFKRGAVVSVVSAIVPAIAILVWQYIAFYTGHSGNTIGVSLLEVFYINSSGWTLVPKLVGSIAFPLALLAVTREKIIQDIEFQLSSAMFVISLFFAYVLVDNVAGRGTGAGNFWWSAQIAHFLLLFVCIKFYLKVIADTIFRSSARQWVLYVPGYVGVIQFISGLIWYSSNVVKILWIP
ncbi:MAG: hypothetical protein COA36_01450 [Desulfotalea sp.]|nr:MAG: hypothetical protein COA36_01450 [Desulfotalea sp.]